MAHSILKIHGGSTMHFIAVSGLIAGILAVLVGVIIIIWPRVVAYIIGAYMIVVGIIAIINAVR